MMNYGSQEEYNDAMASQAYEEAENAAYAAEGEAAAELAAQEAESGIDFSKTLIRCSGIHHIMGEIGLTEKQQITLKELSQKEKLTEKQKVDLRILNEKKSNPDLPDGIKTHLMDIYVSAKYGRQDDIYNRYLLKGMMVEEDSITLYSRFKKRYYKKNDAHLSNDWIKGTPDLFEGEKIKDASHIIDTKSSWDIFTFFRTKTKPINKDYYWQLMGYMALTGAKTATLAYCLINTPEILINDEKRKMFYRMGVVSEDNTDYLKGCAELDSLMTYDDIPLHEKVIEFQVERNESDIKKIYERVDKCRKHLLEIEKMFKQTSMPLDNE